MTDPDKIENSGPAPISASKCAARKRPAAAAEDDDFLSQVIVDVSR